MNKLAGFIVKRRLLLVIVFSCLLLAAVVCIPFVGINYDSSKYLPADSETARALKVMQEEFGDNGDLAVMTEIANIRAGIDLKKRIAQVAGVKSALWLDDILLNFKHLLPGDVSDETFLNYVIGQIEKNPDIIPEEYRPQLDSFYKDGYCLITVTMAASAYDSATVKAVGEIQKLGNLYLTGQAATAYSTLHGIISETLRALLVLLPILIALLLLGTSSFFEPVVLIGVIGVSVLINMGTNIVLGEISYLTQSVAAILQLALSMDYSIFLMKKYRKERKEGLSKEEAMRAAIKKSLSPVSASSLTTIAGFVALMFMRYRIGLDMGIVLAKGIFISLVTVFLLMPALVVYADKLLMKTHRSIPALLKAAMAKKSKRHQHSDASCAAATANSPAEEAVARKNGRLEAAAAGPSAPVSNQPYRTLTRVVKKTRFVLPILALAIMIPCFFLQRSNIFMYGEFACTGAPGTKLYEDRAAVTEVFGNRNNTVVLIPLAAADKEAELAGRLAKITNVNNVQCYALTAELTGESDALKEQFYGSGYYRIILNLDTEEESEAAFAAVAAVRAEVQSLIGGDCLIMGASPAALDIKNVVTVDFDLVNLLTIILIGVILFITFKSLLVPLILLAAIQGSIWMNMAIPFLFGEPMVFIGYLIVTCIQMGATIDYGILISNNYLTARRGQDKFEALAGAVGASAGPILLSGSILCVAGFVIGIICSLPSTSVMGLAIGRGALTSMLMMLFIVPQLLVIMDKPIRYTMLGGRKLKADR